MSQHLHIRKVHFAIEQDNQKTSAFLDFLDKIRNKQDFFSPMITGEKSWIVEDDPEDLESK